MAEKEPRINGNIMPAKGLSSTSTAKGHSSFTKEASPLALGEKKLCDGSSATPVMLASKRNAISVASIAAASYRPLTPKKIASLTESDLRESEFDILLDSNSVVTDLTLDEFIAPPFKGQEIKMTKLWVDVASASHAAAVFSNSKKTVDSTIDKVALLFRYKPSNSPRISGLRQEQSQSSSNPRGSQSVPNRESLDNKCNESLSKSNYPPAAPGCNSQANPVDEVNHWSTEALLASLTKEALMSLHGSEGCASPTADENLAHARSWRRGTIDSRAKRSHDADAQRERRSLAPIKRRRSTDTCAHSSAPIRSLYSQDDVTCEAIPGEYYQC